MQTRFINQFFLQNRAVSENIDQLVVKMIDLYTFFLKNVSLFTPQNSTSHIKVIIKIFFFRKW